VQYGAQAAVLKKNDDNDIVGSTIVFPADVMTTIIADGASRRMKALLWVKASRNEANNHSLISASIQTMSR
jgi:hypothetical protein